MNENDYNEKEEKSLLKDMANDISKKIKTMPLKYKLIIFGVIFGIVFFLLIFIVLISPLIVLFDFDGSGSAPSNLSYIETNSEDNYWWPIGGSEVITDDDGIEYAIGTPTSLTITSYYDLNRTIQGISSPHPAIDIGGSGSGIDYIIASMKGIVLSTNDTCQNNGAFNVEGVSSCGGGFGNYVILEHPGGVYTVYAHLYPGSVTVSAGENVNQGQIIGIMGNSGNSTGTHLHFQLEVGGRGSMYAVNPLDYVFEETPRPVTVQSGSNLAGGNEMLAMLQSWEGTGPANENNYIVYDDGYGTLTVGHGVTIGYNIDRFREKGIDTSKLGSGSEISKEIVDAIELEILEEQRTSVINLLNNNNISLEEYQIDALTIRMYNVGNVNGFPDKYREYGITVGLRDNYMLTPVTSNGIYSEGLKRRREAEWNLFYNGTYTYNY